MADIFDRLDLRRIINASGTETGFGASPVRSEVIQAVIEIAPHSVFMTELQKAASRKISALFGAEAGCVTGCTAASIAMSVAAAMTGCDIGKVEQLPDATGMKNEVIMQRGHEVSYGQSVSQNVRIAGARVVEIGTATQAALYQLRHALSGRTAAALYVVSHLTSQNRMILLRDFIDECHAAGVPVIVDAASVPDPTPYIKAGADLVLWSAQKGFSSFTAGIVAGRRDLVHAILYQDHGIGRPMKVGKEGVVGAIAAIEAWASRDVKADQQLLSDRIEALRSRLCVMNGVSAEQVGRQLRLSIDPTQATGAPAVAAYLEAGTPSILVWSHFAPEGELYLSLGKLTDEQLLIVGDRLEEAIRGSAEGYEAKWQRIADSFESRIAEWAP
jgi:uncharacterized pyridoxal phosphate-dependent enzyme